MLAAPLILYMYELEPKPPTHEILQKKHKLAQWTYDSWGKLENIKYNADS